MTFTMNPTNYQPRQWSDEELQEGVRQAEQLANYLQERLNEYGQPGCTPRDSEFRQARTRLNDLVDILDAQAPAPTDEDLIRQLQNTGEAVIRAAVNNPTPENVNRLAYFNQELTRIINEP